MIRMQSIGVLIFGCSDDKERMRVSGKGGEGWAHGFPIRPKHPNNVNHRPTLAKDHLRAGCSQKPSPTTLQVAITVIQRLHAYIRVLKHNDVLSLPHKLLEARL